mmetsp:Transcript_50296/g.150227  ORF Transcript_50296/g.150227 Transcript_50296/m.150227 type:complete len:252 (+) Transcript_50296:651-1406(+)
MPCPRHSAMPEQRRVAGRCAPTPPHDFENTAERRVLIRWQPPITQPASGSATTGLRPAPDVSTGFGGLWRRFRRLAAATLSWSPCCRTRRGGCGTSWEPPPSCATPRSIVWARAAPRGTAPPCAKPCCARRSAWTRAPSWAPRPPGTPPCWSSKGPLPWPRRAGSAACWRRSTRRFCRSWVRVGRTSPQRPEVLRQMETRRARVAGLTPTQRRGAAAARPPGLQAPEPPATASRRRVARCSDGRPVVVLHP